MLGRSQSGSMLNLWVYTLSAGELFAWAGREGGNDRTRIRVAIDLNVYIDLCGRRGENSESRGLLADWIEDEAELCWTPVLKSELSKSPNTDETKIQLNNLAEIEAVAVNSSNLISIQENYIDHWPINISNDNERYDFDHICSSIAANVDVFVTRDENLISYCEEISEILPIRVCRPSVLIADIHEGAMLEIRSPVRVLALEVYESLLTNSQNLNDFSDCSAFRSMETKRQLEAKLRDLIAHPHSVKTYCLRSESGTIEAVYSFRETSDNIVEIELLRLSNGVNETVICEKALRSRVEAIASPGASRLIKITDAIAINEYREILVNLGFFVTSEGLALKLSLGIQLTKQGLGSYLDSELISLDSTISSAQISEFTTSLGEYLKAEVSPESLK